MMSKLWLNHLSSISPCPTFCIPNKVVLHCKASHPGHNKPKYEISVYKSVVVYSIKPIFLPGRHIQYRCRVLQDRGRNMMMKRWERMEMWRLKLSKSHSDSRSRRAIYWHRVWGSEISRQFKQPDPLLSLNSLLSAQIALQYNSAHGNYLCNVNRWQIVAKKRKFESSVNRVKE